MDDWTQLLAWAERRDEEAFATLIDRHLGLVYGAAYRKLENRVAAEEVAQSVFILLAKKAGTLRPTRSLAAWLYVTARRQAIDLYRNESARKRREIAHAMNDETMKQEDPIRWSDIAPILDEAMESLGEKDRLAILLRFFEERPLSEVSEAIGVSEEAARKRVKRSLERLRLWLNRRGIECTAGALGITLGAHAAKSIPLNLTETALQAALAQTMPVSTATTLTTTMASIKLPIAVGLLAGAAVPFTLGHRQDQPEEALFSQDQVSIELNVSLPQPEINGLIAEWIALRDEHGPNGGSMRAFYEAAQQVKDDFKRRVFRTAVVADWAANDPEGALDYFSSERNDSRITDVLRVWLENDASAALTKMETNGNQWDEPIADLLEDLADAHPHALARVAPFVKSRRLFEHHIQDAFAMAARKDLSGMRTAAEALTGKARQEALAGVAKAWAETDGKAALGWVEQMDSSEDRSRALQEVLVGWANVDPSAALDRLDLAPAGGLAPGEGQVQVISGLETSERVLKAAAAADLEATVNWLVENSDKVDPRHLGSSIGRALEDRLFSDVPGTLNMIRDHTGSDILEQGLHYIMRSSGKGYIDDIWDWVREEPPSEVTTAIKKSVFASISARDPQRSLELAREFIEQEEIGAIHFGALRSWFAPDLDGYEQAESVFAHAPEEIRNEVLKNALMRTSAEEVGRDRWEQWLEKLPDDSRREVVVGSVRGIAYSDPAGAVERAVSLTDTDRPHAFHGIAERWARGDSYTASQWIASMEPGIERDHAALALVQSIAKAEPDSAWQWAQTIQMPDQRQQAMHTALRHFGNAALDVISASDLNSAERSALSQWFETQSSHSN